MQNLHVSNNLLGARIVSSRGDTRRIVAVWLEEASHLTRDSKLMVLTVGSDGECFKLELPDTSWDVLL
jgi:hypothetical protein